MLITISPPAGPGDRWYIIGREPDGWCWSVGADTLREAIEFWRYSANARERRPDRDGLGMRPV